MSFNCLVDQQSLMEQQRSYGALGFVRVNLEEDISMQKVEVAMRFVTVFLISLFTLYAGIVSAQESRTGLPAAPPRKAFVGFEPMVGFSAGYMEANDNFRTEGYPVNFKVLGSWYQTSAPLSYDLGFGYQDQQFRQKLTGSDNHIRTGIVEAAARTAISRNWEGGAVWNTYLNEGERYGASSREANFAGLQVLRKIAFQEKYTARVGARVMTDTNIDHGQVNSAFIDLQVGLREHGGTAVARRPTTENVSFTAVSNPIAAVGGAGVGHLNFALNSSNLSGEDRAYIARLGAAIGRHQKEFDTLEIVGHADQTGPDSYNLELSKNRAEEVSRIIMEEAPLREKVDVTWRGSSEPLIESRTPEALRLNRRVELIFRGVRNPNLLEAVMTEIR